MLNDLVVVFRNHWYIMKADLARIKSNDFFQILLLTARTALQNHF